MADRSEYLKAASEALEDEKKRSEPKVVSSGAPKISLLPPPKQEVSPFDVPDDPGLKEMVAGIKRRERSQHYKDLGEKAKEIGYKGLNVAAVLPIGQVPQMAADVGVGAMDLAKGDYTGAAISGAAVLLPVTAGMLKGAIKNFDAAKLVSKLDNVHLEGARTAGAKGAPIKSQRDYYTSQLLDDPSFLDELQRMTAQELSNIYNSLQATAIAISNQQTMIWGKLRRLSAPSKKILGGPGDSSLDQFLRKSGKALKSAEDHDIADTIGDAFDRVEAVKDIVQDQLGRKVRFYPSVDGPSADTVRKAEKGLKQSMDELFSGQASLRSTWK